MKNNNISHNVLSDSTKTSMKARIISALIGIAIVLPCILIGDYFVFALVGVIGLIASYEIAKCVSPKHRISLTIISGIAILAFIYYPLFRALAAGIGQDFRIFDAYNAITVSIIVIGVLALIMFFLTIIFKDFGIKDAAILFITLVVIGLGLEACLFLRFLPSALYHHNVPTASYWNSTYNAENATLIIFVLCSTYFSDAGAYFVGVFFGKHKLCERISPKKTWEGFIGGIVISAILSMVMAFTLSLTGHPLLPGVLDIDHWYVILLLSLFIPIVAVLGDFAFSIIKRNYGIKDYGTIMPGHGGVLDRIDSILFTCLLSAIIIYIFALAFKCPIVR